MDLIKRSSKAAPRVPKAWSAGVVITLAAFLVLAPWIVPVLLGDFWVIVLTEIMIWTLFAASANLLFGYAGLLSFGQALYFGFGAYGVAFGVLYLGLGFWASLAVGVLASVAIAAVAGIFAVRLTWHYFAIITIVFSLIFYLLVIGAKDLTGGDDGISFSPPPIFQLGDLEITLLDEVTQYFFVLVIVALCFAAKRMLIRSPFGMAMMAVRENADRAGLIGLDVLRVRYVAFVLAGGLAGMSGALFTLFSRYASAHYMYWTVSGEAVIWTIVGGTGTLLGPAFGTAFLVVLREELSVYWEHYLLILGLLIILMVTFAPDGLAGLFRRLEARLWRSAHGDARQTSSGPKE
jgi:branched-chain amino acid transport system permease protein